MSTRTSQRPTMSTRIWQRRWRVGRVQIGYRVMRHRFPLTTDRWVFHPSFVYDCKHMHHIGGGTDGR